MTETIMNAIKQMQDDYFNKLDEAEDSADKNYYQGGIDALTDLLEVCKLVNI